MFVFMFFVALAWGQTATTESALDLANARLINAQAALVEARAQALGRLTVSVTDLSGDKPCGDPPNYGGRFVGANARDMRRLYNECMDSRRDLLYARVVQTGQVVGDSTYANPERGVLTNGNQSAAMAAWNDFPEGAGFNGLTRLPYGASVFDTFQGNTMTVQMLLAGQQMPIAPRQPLGQPTPVTATRTDLEDAARAMQAAAQ
jgi:hypothetical protein